MKVGVVQFPGSNCDSDVFYVCREVLNQETIYLWHEEKTLHGCDFVILPGGFSYGDYLRPGAMAKLSPILTEIKNFAFQGGMVLGICNGFQVLTESGLLPGSLLKNENGRFICQWTSVRVENIKTPFTSLYRKWESLKMPIAHGEGRYFVDKNTLSSMEQEEQIVFRYDLGNPNGSMDFIAGVCNQKKNVLGLMPHPERCSESVLKGEDGLRLFQSVFSLSGHPLSRLA
jgi:phosphoribosylformylglycinamidine synthase